MTNLKRSALVKIAHEAPLSIFNEVQKLTDYDYALVHLFEENIEYLTKFELAVAKGREVILDNSIFELGTAFDPARFATWVEHLQPTWYIVPDVLEEKDATIESFKNFMEKYPNLPGKSIGVVQGKSYEEIVECYRFMEANADKIAISFDYSYFEDLFPDEPTKYHSWMKGRQELLVKLLEDGVINVNKPHHLLGCGLPQEFEMYQNMHWIDSVDTSNPVVHGIKGIGYTWTGLENKESVKLFTLMDEDVLEHLDDIRYNIKMFRSFCNV